MTEKTFENQLDELIDIMDLMNRTFARIADSLSSLEAFFTEDD